MGGCLALLLRSRQWKQLCRDHRSWNLLEAAMQERTNRCIAVRVHTQKHRNYEGFRFSEIHSSAYQLNRAANFEPTAKLVTLVLKKLSGQQSRHLGRLQGLREVVAHAQGLTACVALMNCTAVSTQSVSAVHGL